MALTRIAEAEAESRLAAETHATAMAEATEREFEREMGRVVRPPPTKNRAHLGGLGARPRLPAWHGVAWLDVRPDVWEA